eukprot:CAMPEP_0183344490 /NCGR_PEP_ID=MMETSP0164_2-20130417/10156_1 /TAXON_ID=221442 /ORGANISM="Coccolithus pelagicus ssp braarudi, Strain PLY182g" /LENGTH=100 /DNA_ID=CAMNT_0025515491 /DNA_START=233 /DNA_END=535 /DNA_ORIENTATION=-
MTGSRMTSSEIGQRRSRSSASPPPVSACWVSVRSRRRSAASAAAVLRRTCCSAAPAEGAFSRSIVSSICSCARSLLARRSLRNLDSARYKLTEKKLLISR